VYYGSAAWPAAIEGAPAAAADGFSVAYGGDVGFSAAALGDVNGDGFEDLAVGGSASARVCVILGGSGEVGSYDCGADGASFGLGENATQPGFYVTGATDAGETGGFGFSLAAAGDVNGDGYADFVVGEPGYDHDAGAAHVFLGARTGARRRTTTSSTRT